MPWYNKVVWHEGQFLRPQLFQQQERYLENYAHRRSSANHAFFWGFSKYRIDESALTAGKLVVSSATGVYPDGTPFDAPGDADLPEPLTLTRAHVGQVIHLALPIRIPNGVETDFSDATDSLSRYKVFDEEINDATSIALDRIGKAIQLSNLRLRLLAQSELSKAWLGLPLARVTEVDASGAAALDQDMIPPVLGYGAAPMLKQWLEEMAALVRSRATSLAKHIEPSGMSNDTTEISDYLILQLLNRFDPRLHHLLRTPGATPEHLYLELLTLAGELSTFVRVPTHRPRQDDQAHYEHRTPHTCLAPVVADLRELLNVVLQRAAQRIALRPQRHGVHVAVLDPQHFSHYASFVLAVAAHMPSGTLSVQFVAQTKAGPSERLSELIHAQLPGLALQPLAVPPRHIPFHSGSVYFEIDQRNPLWAQVAQYGGLALHVAGNFPGLQMELWGIRA